MVDAATGNITTSYTYDPLGSAAVTGSGYQTAYQFQGMENDSWAYYGDRHYYSPIMGRPLSSTGPLTASGGYDSGLAGAISAAMPGSGSDPGFSPINLTAFEIGAGTFAATEATLDALIASDLLVGETNPGTAVPAAVVAAIAEAIYQLLDIFGVFGGGSPYIPPFIRFKLAHQGGSPQALGGLIGMRRELAPSQQAVSGDAPPSSGIVQVRYNVPFTRLPESADESPGEGWVRRGPNWYNPKTGDSLHPDNHPPKGPHFDVHSRHPKWSMSMRNFGPDIQVWDEDTLTWIPWEDFIEILPLE